MSFTNKPLVKPPAEAPSPPRQSTDFDTSTLARATVQGVGWVFLARLGSKFSVLIGIVVLARLLDQSDFGVAAYAVTVVAMLNAIPGLGIGPALIYHRDDPTYADTGFWLMIGSGFLAFALLWVAAPLTEHIFGDERAVAVTRMLGLIFPIEALRNVHAALLRRHLRFRSKVLPELGQAVSRMCLSIALALWGFGPWSLILGTLGGALASVPLYWRALRWRPSLRFDLGAARDLLPYGGNLVALNTLGALVRNLDCVAVGSALGAVALGVYVLAFRIPDLLIRQLSLILSQVLFPVFTKVKDDQDKLHDTFASTLGYVFAITAPLSIGLALLAGPFVETLLSDKWLACAAVIPPICVYTLCMSIVFNIGDLYKAVGRPGILTKLALLRVALIIPALWVAIQVGGTPAAVGWAQGGVALAHMGLSLVVAHVVLGLSMARVARAVAPVMLACAAMAVAVLGVRSLGSSWSALALLSAGVGAGAVVYLIALRLAAREFVDTAFKELHGAILPRRKAAGATS